MIPLKKLLSPLSLLLCLLCACGGQSTGSGTLTFEIPEKVEAAEAPEEAHNYALFLSDCTWSEAFALAEEAGGTLVRLETEEEFEAVTALLTGQDVLKVEYRIGGRRDPDSKSYQWTDETDTLYGEVLNAEGSWAMAHWSEGEPSYVWQDNQEVCMELIYNTDEGVWEFNDIPDRPYSPGEGKYGYILEFVG